MSNASNFVEFLNSSHSPFHAVAEVEKQLNEAGFIKLRENATWNLENNRFYYVVRNQSSLIAFKIPEMISVKSVNIVASHSDSPSLRIKPVAAVKDAHYGKLGVEVYGGAILSTWLDRPLGIAGRVTVKENGVLVNRLVDFEDESVIIPNVAIHQNREVNDGYKWNEQIDMVPMVDDKDNEKYLEDMICAKLSCDRDNIMGHELYLYNQEPAKVWGNRSQFVSGQRIDNLESVFTSAQAFLNSYSNNSINIISIFDNEEVGSLTKQGMASSFLADTIERIFACFYYSRNDVKAVLANSFLLSADNGHAVHPNHPELYDGANAAYLNHGVIIKTSSAMRYINDSTTWGVVKQLADRAGVPYQLFANKSGAKGGGTQTAIGSICLPVMAADIGLPQLAMHSCYETAGARDVDYMISLMSEFFNSTVTVDDDKVIISK
ncbi:MAG: M18 family aminopeptidase [Erysipelotrichaceae bacterium]|nr:M18 family aminopeptidase [Erysipelotrichaceae bacterium]